MKRAREEGDDVVLRVAIVGCGNIAYKHIAAMASGEPARYAIVALCDPDPANRKKVSARVVERLACVAPQEFASLSEAIAADPDQALFDTVDVLVPSVKTLHEDVAIEAMESSRHVILEKPVALTLASARRILAAKERLIPSKVLMVAENAAYWPEVLAAKKAIAEGAIGKVLTARAKFWESASKMLNEWAVNYEHADSYYNRSDEGIVFDAGFHWIRPLRLFLGDVESAVATAGVSFSKMKGATMIQALLKTTSGCTAVYEGMLVPSAISDQPFFRIQGELGEIVIEGWGGGGCKLYTEVESGLECKTLSNEGWDGGYANELADFAAAVLDGKDLDAGPEEAVKDLATILTMFKAAHSGKWESVAGLEEDACCGSLAGWRAK